jgi:hypothetical protein
MPGVVSLPHGWGNDHNDPPVGVRYNDLADTRSIDAVSGNGALNGIAVQVHAMPE